MILKSGARLFKSFVFGLAAFICLPLGVYASADLSLPSEQTEYVIVDAEEQDLVGQSYMDARAESGARLKIHEALKQHAEVVDISEYRLTYDEARALLKDIVYWDGSLYYVQPLCSGMISGGYTKYLYPRYIEHEEEIAKALKRVVRESNITPDMSDLQKMLALHNWLTANCQYDYTYSKYSVYDALVTGSSVCQGYKDSYEMLLRYVGILEIGSASGGDHTWNQVKLDGQWYNVDTTWDSNMIEGRPLGEMDYRYFMGSDMKFSDHTFSVQDHVCTSTLYDEDAWWNADEKVRSSVIPINGAGSWRIGYEDSVMNLIYRAEASGTEKVVYHFPDSTWGYRDGNYFFSYDFCYGVLQRTGGTTFANDAKNVYCITDQGNVSVIYTYEGNDGRNIFGIRVKDGKLEAQIGYKPYGTESEIKSIPITQYIDTQDPEEKLVSEFVKRMYRITLDREADADGLQYYVTRLQSGEADGASVAQFFVGSPEFQNKNLSLEAYLKALYSAFFDRAPADSEIVWWKNQMASGLSRKYVLSCFVNSPEFSEVCRKAGITRGTMVLAEGEKYEVNLEKLGAFVDRLYEKALKRPSDQNGRQYYVEQISNRKITAEQAAKNFFFSPEFEGFKTSDQEYIERLYLTFMGRASEPDGVYYWLNKMRGGMTREQVLSSFAASPEFNKIMEGFGIR